MKELNPGNAVKAAMKNMSVSLENVAPELLSKILEETEVKLAPLNDFTHRDIFSDYLVSYRDGHRIKTKNGVEYSEFSKDELVVNILSKRYELLQHRTVLENVSSVLEDQDINYSVSKLYIDQRHGSNKFYATLTLDDISVDVDGSPISPAIDVFNSTDGSLAAGILFGAYRFKCSNGMLLGNTYGLEKIIHSPSAINKLNFGKMFERIMMDFKDLHNSIESMQAIKYSHSMLETLKAMRFNSMFIKHYDCILEKYMIDNREDADGNTAWGLYSTATNYISNYIMLKSIREAVIQQNIINKFKDSLLSR